jgi:hypothetical protein
MSAVITASITGNKWLCRTAVRKSLLFVMEDHDTRKFNCYLRARERLSRGKDLRKNLFVVSSGHLKIKDQEPRLLQRYKTVSPRRTRKARRGKRHCS